MTHLPFSLFLSFPEDWKAAVESNANEFFFLLQKPIYELIFPRSFLGKRLFEEKNVYL